MSGILLSREEDIRILASFLYPLLPDTCVVYHLIKEPKKEILDYFNISIYVNSISPFKFNTVVLIHGPGNTIQYQQERQQLQEQHEQEQSEDLSLSTSSIEQNTPQQYLNPTSRLPFDVSYYTTDFPTCITILKAHVPFHHPFEFAGILRSQIAPINQLQLWYSELRQIPLTNVIAFQDKAVQYTLCHPANLISPPSTPFLSTLAFRPLPITMEMAELVAKHWIYSREHTPKLIYYYLKSYLCYGAFLPSSSTTPSPPPSSSSPTDTLPIAWCLTQNYGALGMLHVLEEHRGKCIAGKLMYEMCVILNKQRQAKYAQLGNNENTESNHILPIYDEFTPFVCIIETNSTSRQLFSKLGFENIIARDWIEWSIKKRKGNKK